VTITGAPATRPMTNPFERSGAGAGGEAGSEVVTGPT
jgi:hypothetical protein